MTVSSARLLALIATLRVVDWSRITSAWPSIDSPQISACELVDSFFMLLVRDLSVKWCGDDGGVGVDAAACCSVAVMNNASVRKMLILTTV